MKLKVDFAGKTQLTKSFWNHETEIMEENGTIDFNTPFEALIYVAKEMNWD